jgi:hypothetical protein
LGGRFAEGVYGCRRAAIGGKAFFIKLRKLFASLPQWTLGGIGGAAPPELVGRCIEENCGPVTKKVPILLLDEGATAEGDDGIPLQGVQQMLEGGRFGGTESWFSGGPEYLGHSLFLAGGDALIEIREIPIETTGESLAYAALSRSHESDEKHRTHSHGAPWRDTTAEATDSRAFSS